MNVLGQLKLNIGNAFAASRVGGLCTLSLVLAALFAGQLIPLRTDGVHYQWNDGVDYMQQSICRVSVASPLY